jgi:NAD(P)-dependent dehydrogenase (short-subunit alcohol dehydrogenase family)
MEIRGKVAVVTGAGSGIGRATAIRLAQEGASVAVSDRDEAGSEETARMIRGGGGEALFVCADVTDDGALRSLFETATQHFGGIDIVFNNAGITSGLPIWPDTPPEKWGRTLEVNLWAVIRGTQLAIPYLKERGGGVIVNNASMAGLNGFALDPVYSASKGGVVLFTRSLARMKETDNISVCCVCPGVVDTAIWRGAEDPRMRGLIDQLPQRFAPEAIADAVVFLVMDERAAGKALAVRSAEERRYVEPALTM